MNSSEFEFEKIHEAFRQKIHRYLSRMVGEMEAEDLTQEVFLKVSHALMSFRGEAALSTWIYRIATNTALDKLRKRSFQEKGPGDLADPQIVDREAETIDRNAWTGEEVPSVEPQVYRKEMAACIQDYIQSLPKRYRTVMVLSEFEGLSNQQIAEILGITLDTVKIRLHRAREMLRNELATKCDLFWLEDNEFLPELKDYKRARSPRHKRSQ